MIYLYTLYSGFIRNIYCNKYLVAPFTAAQIMRCSLLIFLVLKMFNLHVFKSVLGSVYGSLPKLNFLEF